jgi:cytochrome c oxidase subunit 5a
VLVAALKAARRVNDYPTAVRIFEGKQTTSISPLSWVHPVSRKQYICELMLTRLTIGIKAKVENKTQYNEYLDELKPLREELGVSLKEDLFPEEAK